MLFLIRHRLQNSTEALRVSLHQDKSGSEEPFNHDAAHTAARLTKLLADLADRADGIKVALSGRVDRQISLGYEKNGLILFGGCLERADGCGTLYIEGHKHPG